MCQGETRVADPTPMKGLSPERGSLSGHAKWPNDVITRIR